MYNIKNNLVILFIIISIIGFFLPWFYFEKSVDYRTGVYWIKDPNLILGYLGAIISCFLEKSKISFIIIICIVIYLIYIFLTWHILTITGEFDINTSITTAHYGFYLSLVSMIIASILNIVIIRKERK